MIILVVAHRHCVSPSVSQFIIKNEEGGSVRGRWPPVQSYEPVTGQRRTWAHYPQGSPKLPGLTMEEEGTCGSGQELGVLL